MSGMGGGNGPVPVVIEDLSHSYGSGPVLDGVGLEVAPGEHLSLLGPSGCGKTTLLRSIAGLERPERGAIRLGSVEVTGPGAWVPPERRRVGMVFQDWALFPHMTVAENVSYGLNRNGRGGERVAETLAMVGLSGMEDRTPDTLSGGERQRVALARALAPQPQVLLLDEPFSSLDTALRVEIRTDMHRLLVKLGITSVFVTHDQEAAFVVGDRIAVMTEGRIVQVDTPHGLYTRPADRWVASFVGEGSLLPGQAADGVAATPIGSVPVTGASRGAVDVLVRPEDLAMVPGDAGTVEMIEFYGHDAMVFVALNGGTLKVRTGPDPGVGRGQQVGIEFSVARARAFPSG